MYHHHLARDFDPASSLRGLPRIPDVFHKDVEAGQPPVSLWGTSEMSRLSSSATFLLHGPLEGDWCQQSEKIPTICRKETRFMQVRGVVQRVVCSVAMDLARRGWPRLEYPGSAADRLPSSSNSRIDGVTIGSYREKDCVNQAWLEIDNVNGKSK